MRRPIVGCGALVGLLCLAVFARRAGAQTEPIKRHDTYILGQDKFAAGGIASLRVAVSGVRSLTEAEPLPGADVEILFRGKDKDAKPVSLFAGKTDATGSVYPQMQIPDVPEGPYVMLVKTRSPFGDEEVTKEVTVTRDAKILLVTDKPLYQPGQQIQIRALALHTINLKPIANSGLLFEIFDGKGNKVFKRPAQCSNYGIASAVFQLADEVNMGAYRITASIDKTQAEKQVTVKRYVLPKFKAAILTEKKFFLPKELVKGHLQADYFFGKPVAGAEVIIKASTFDVAFREFALLKDLKTDSKGRCEFEFRLPDYFVGQPLEKGEALLRIAAVVKDQADHVQTASRSFNVSSQPMRIAAVPESGKIVPDLENILYAVVTYPDGAPAEGVNLSLEIGAPPVKLTGKTSAGGAAQFRVTPKKEWLKPGAWVMERRIFPRGGQFVPKQRSQARVVNVTIRARDKQGAEASVSQQLASEAIDNQILLRPNKSIYAGGETIELEVLTASEGGNVYLDVNKSRQTMLTRTVPIQKGHGATDVDLGAEVFGTLEIHAYKVFQSGQIVRDSKIIYVHPATELAIKVDPSKAVYRPGEEPVEIKFLVSDGQGTGVPCALGLIIVDESVYAIQDMQPGLEKVYFTLEKELAEPKVTLENLPWRATELVERQKLEAARDEAARILFASAEPLSQYRWQHNPAIARLAQVQQNLYAITQALLQHVTDRRPFAARDEKTGQWGFSPQLLEELVKASRLRPEQIADPLVKGKDLTIAGLGSLGLGLEYPKWSAGATDLRKHGLWQALSAYCTNHQVVEPDGQGGWRYAAGLVQTMIEAKALRAEDTRTPEGEAITLKTLAQTEAAFAPANVAKLVDTMRRQTVFNRLSEHVRAKGLAALMGQDPKAKEWHFKPEAAALLGIEKSTLTDAAGNGFSLADLARSDPAFAPQNLANMTIGQKLNRIYSAVCRYYHHGDGKKYQKGGKWQLPENAMELMVQAKRLSKENTVGPWGGPLRLGGRTKAGGWSSGCGIARQFRVFSAGPDGKVGTADDWEEPSSAGGSTRPQPAKGLVHYQATAWNELTRAIGGRWGGRGLVGGKLRNGLRRRGARQLLGAALPAAPRPTLAAPRKKEALKAAAVEMEEDLAMAEGGEATGAARGRKPPRIREYFPETLLFEPALITDERGRATLTLDRMADSVTTWRLTAAANSADGRLGSTSAGLRAFQDFFVDIDLPVSLTQNDEVSVPVAVYNYLAAKQTVRLELARDSWFQLLDEDVKSLSLDSNDVTVVYFRLRAREIGYQKLLVRAFGSKMSDAIRRTIEVAPDGKKFETVLNERLTTGSVAKEIRIPENAVPGSFKIMCKCYPGVFSTIMEGMEGMLRMPGGCFEQTSSSAYPNVLALDYMDKAGAILPAVKMKADAYINMGYQRLLTFQRPEGGFDWWGSGPPLVFLTAYGIQEFHDMGKVYPIDSNVIERARQWLYKMQGPNGAWTKVGATHGLRIQRFKEPAIPLTAYVAWSLLEAGDRSPAVGKAVAFLEDKLDEAAKNRYVLALTANAMTAHDPKGKAALAVLDTLEKSKKTEGDDLVYWSCDGQTMYYGSGKAGDVETTALATYAMVRSGVHTETVNKALAYLVKARGGRGTWGSTQATILAMKALIAGLGGVKPSEKAELTFTVGDKRSTIEVTPENADVMQLLDFKDATLAGINTVRIDVKGKTNVMYQIVGRYFLPWSAAREKPEAKPIEIDLQYDRTTLKKDDTLTANVRVRYNAPTSTYMVVVDLGIPPGFKVDPGDFAELLGQKKIEKYSLTGRQITLYLGTLVPKQEVSFSYTLTAKYPIKAKTPQSVVYEYYTPQNRDLAEPVTITVE